MAGRFLPTTIDNAYRGRKLGLWLLWIVVIVKVVQSVTLIMDSPGILASADGIPLATFPPDAARTAVAAFVGMSVSRLALCLLCAVVLVRYRRAVAPLFVLLLVHDLARELVLGPVRVGAPIGPWVNGALMALTLAGIALATWPARRAHAAGS